MLSSLKKIFSQKEENSDDAYLNDPLYLLCGLMIEAADTDGKIEQSEIDKISSILISTFKEDSKEVSSMLNKCIDEKNEPKSLFFFTSKINKIFSQDKKNLLIETLWEIVLADNKVHEYESNLIRRLAGLLYISDVECGNAKKIALKNLKKEEIINK